MWTGIHLLDSPQRSDPIVLELRKIIVRQLADWENCLPGTQPFAAAGHVTLADLTLYPLLVGITGHGLSFEEYLTCKSTAAIWTRGFG